jgi:hypothetical protein
MRWSILFTLACGCSISGCHIEKLDCDDDEHGHCCPAPWEEEARPSPADGGDRPTGTGGKRGRIDGSGGSSEAGGANAASGGAPAEGAGGASTSAGGASTSAGGANDDAGASKVMPCTVESDCARGYNCDAARGQCLPSDAETCPELTTEASCSARKDCTTVYAGTNCTCGPDCQCTGGEPGCICERFEFFRCAAIQ